MSNDTHPAALTANDGPRFERGDLIRNVKSMRLYVILLAPPLALLERTGEPCYVYTQYQGPDPRAWIRPLHDMEEAGRFVLHKKRPLI